MHRLPGHCTDQHSTKAISTTRLALPSLRARQCADNGDLSVRTKCDVFKRENNAMRPPETHEPLLLCDLRMLSRVQWLVVGLIATAVILLG